MKLELLRILILLDQNKDLLKQENETVSVDGVNGPAIILGSLTDVSENGNWPSIFDASCKIKITKPQNYPSLYLGMDFLFVPKRNLVFIQLMTLPK